MKSQFLDLTLHVQIRGGLCITYQFFSVCCIWMVYLFNYRTLLSKMASLILMFRSLCWRPYCVEFDACGYWFYMPFTAMLQNLSVTWVRWQEQCLWVPMFLWLMLVDGLVVWCVCSIILEEGTASRIVKYILSLSLCLTHMGTYACSRAHTHTHTRVCVCVCVCLCHE